MNHGALDFSNGSDLDFASWYGLTGRRSEFGRDAQNNDQGRISNDVEG